MPLIERDALIADNNANLGGVSHAVYANRIVYAQPIIDAVPVVRCKDCIYRRTYSYLIHRCDCKDGLKGELQDNDFCSYGEKRSV